MIVVSDMMGTLTTGSPILGIVDWIRHKQSRNQARWHMTAMLPGYLVMKAGLIDQRAWGQKLMVESLAWIQAATVERFDEVAEWVVEANLWPHRREDIIERLKAHAREGDRVTLASSVPEPIAQAFARRIGVNAIGTPIAIENGQVYLKAGLIASERKIQEVLKRLHVSSIGYAYGDTALDIPLLESAEHPVAVYPDKRLLAVARERGWVILGDSH